MSSPSTPSLSFLSLSLSIYLSFPYYYSCLYFLPFYIPVIITSCHRSQSDDNLYLVNDSSEVLLRKGRSMQGLLDQPSAGQPRGPSLPFEKSQVLPDSPKSSTALNKSQGVSNSPKPNFFSVFGSVIKSLSPQPSPKSEAREVHGNSHLSLSLSLSPHSSPLSLHPLSSPLLSQSKKSVLV